MTIKEILSRLTDEDIFEIAAERMKKKFLKLNGADFKFGHFRFMFHEGSFKYVEGHPRERIYESLNRNTSDSRLRGIVKVVGSPDEAAS